MYYLHESKNRPAPLPRPLFAATRRKKQIDKTWKHLQLCPVWNPKLQWRYWVRELLFPRSTVADTLARALAEAKHAMSNAAVSILNTRGHLRKQFKWASIASSLGSLPPIEAVPFQASSDGKRKKYRRRATSTKDSDDDLSDPGTFQSSLLLGVTTSERRPVRRSAANVRILAQEAATLFEDGDDESLDESWQESSDSAESKDWPAPLILSSDTAPDLSTSPTSQNALAGKPAAANLPIQSPGACEIASPSSSRAEERSCATISASETENHSELDGSELFPAASASKERTGKRSHGNAFHPEKTTRPKAPKRKTAMEANKNSLPSRELPATSWSMELKRIPRKCSKSERSPSRAGYFDFDFEPNPLPYYQHQAPPPVVCTGMGSASPVHEVVPRDPVGGGHWNRTELRQYSTEHRHVLCSDFIPADSLIHELENEEAVYLSTLGNSSDWELSASYTPGF